MMASPRTTLSALLAEFVDVSSCPATPITGLSLDSREVSVGDVFIALKGSQTSGAQYITQALEQGAVAILIDAGEKADDYGQLPVPVIAVPKLSEFVSDIAGAFYAHPSRQMKVTAVTGTNGKTTCAQLLANLFELLGEPAGCVGTVGYGTVANTAANQVAELLPCSEVAASDILTTPDAVAMQRILAELRDAGSRRVVIEASSHGLAQRRVAGLQIDTAIFTNLSRDHLDYHGDLNRYAAAKSRLFGMSGLKHAVINLDDNVGRLILANLDPAVDGITYSFENHTADIHCDRIELGASAIAAELVTPWGRGRLTSPLLGKFNLANLLAVIGAAGMQGFRLDDILRAAAKLKAVPGRMEVVDPSARPLVVVDYAHTPDALDKVLRALRLQCSGKLWVVFGCGGDRDKGKRAEMGRVADQLADSVVVTSDNPRSESPEQIIQQVLLGITRKVLAVTDRRDAIRAAINAAAVDDIVLIAGKGHEAYQIVAAKRLPFSDLAEAALALRQKAEAEDK
ncbi:UDP-N-acetylmuramoyl-L-alanyl-D-glutamate--2,6-diaminopimelate ligase [SAR92 clade bacterium H455]|uniref:UDP-N-acetylmuramoyl-L-alanyl-D-glutamate--2,6-diaminopimelate ligase n=1 Tax=SAR92 clade bacterium H455 TaxID=2974818 RepID=A0ABY5TQ02_9GAMM|nr:UDP-N-acetylmuramoyl-L-alanyl-D-glutamate--2,6-diaminopimelate ligase [SAR92 clade bacterium H455]